MRKDIMLIRVPQDTSNIDEIGNNFSQRLVEWYTIIVIRGDVNEMKVELINPTFLNYIKYKFRNMFYGKKEKR